MSDYGLDSDEIAVVAHAATGLTWQEIGTALGSSERTVRRRLASAAAKLGTSGMTNTVAVAVARGLVDPEKPPAPATVVSRAPRRPGSAASGPKPGKTIAAALPEICARLPAVHGVLPLACEAAGIRYDTVIARQKVDPDLRQALLAAGWVPRRWVRMAAALDTVLARVAEGATVGQAIKDSGLSYPTWRSHLKGDARLRERLAQARTAGREHRGLPVDRVALLTAVAEGVSVAEYAERVGASRSRLYQRIGEIPGLREAVREARAARTAGSPPQAPRRRSRGSRWRQGERGSKARREHNIETRDLRRKKTLARFTPGIERTLLESLREGVPLVEAAAQVGMQQQTLFGRARFDHGWKTRLDRALMAGRNPDVRHGTDYVYKQYGCRCPECREAHARFRS